MPETKRPLKVFLCHAHSDKDAVKALYTRLTEDGGCVAGQGETLW
jgi:hypothetical protein